MEGLLTFPSAAFVAALAGVVAIASWTDVTQRRIPNWLCAANFALGLGYTGLAYGGSGAGWTEVGLAALHAFAALLVTMVLFAMRAIGAGDAKFYASMAAWLPINQGLGLLVAVSLAGLVLLVVFFLTRVRGRNARDPATSSHFDKLPYGVAIGFGGLAAVALA